jgi:hypothetical protein
MDMEKAAVLWGITPRSVKKAIKESRVRYSVGVGGEISIPDDEIRPLPKSTIQSFLWVVLRVKNDPSWHYDISKVPKISIDQIRSVFKQLIFRKYLDQVNGEEDIESLFKDSRITDLGLDLVNKKRFPGSYFSDSVIQGRLDVLVMMLIDKLPAILGISYDV